MDLNDTERAELLSIRANAEGDEYRVDGVRPPGSKDKFVAWRKRMKTLQDAWLAVDFDTQQTVIAELASRHDDPDGPVADLADVVTCVLNDARRSSGSPLKTPGFGEATMFLWGIWCRDRPGIVNCDEDARKEIGAVIAETFGLTTAAAGRRAQEWINRRYQTHGDVPGR